WLPSPNGVSLSPLLASTLIIALFGTVSNDFPAFQGSPALATQPPHLVARRQQLVQPTARCYPAFVEHQDLVGAFQDRTPVRNGQDGGTLRDHRIPIAVVQ